MARLRIRIELNRRSAGVPLDKLANVVEETRKFFQLLAEDVQIESGRGEWLASDFDTESLNFTAEYSGPVSSDQVRAFGAAFAGATSLRQATIAQFTRIADFIGEDELVGFGLFQSEQETEPSEWRCLSRRDALRFADEIRLLAKVAGQPGPESALPTVMNGSVGGRRLFKDRKERDALASDPSKWVREVESSLSRRIALLEDEVAAHKRRIQDLGNTPEVTEERFRQLLGAMESFWRQAPSTQALLPAPASAPVSAPPPAPVSVPAAAPRPALIPDSVSKIRGKAAKRWGLGLLLSAAVIALAGFAAPQFERLWSHFASIAAMPALKMNAPAPPSDSLSPEPRRASASKPVQRFLGPETQLDIPPAVRPRIKSDVSVLVTVAIDDKGNVTDARVTATEGDGARLLTNVALRAARQQRYHPAQQGRQNVPSLMDLTYLFKANSQF